MTSPGMEPVGSPAAAEAFRRLAYGHVVEQRWIVATPDLAPRLASAALRSRLFSGQYLVVVLIVVAGGAVYAGTTADLRTPLTFVVIFVLVLLSTPWLSRGRLAQVMVARGFGPGAVVTVDYYPDSLLISASTGIARYAFADLLPARRLGGCVIVGVRPSRLLLVLPDELAAGPLAPGAGRPR